MANDIIIRGGTLVTPVGPQQADLAIADGRIAAIGPALGGAAEEIDATGLVVMPAIIDVHLHFNEPGRTEWEGAATGSRALAAGGGALFFDMPLNSTPCTLNAREFDRKREALAAASIADFALWGGLVPGAIAQMAELADRGAIGFKAFMCDSGLPEFPRADDMTLLDGMREAARLGLPVAVHAESESLTRGFASRKTGRTARDFLESRPVICEVEAIQRALLFAAESGVSLHLVHVSSGIGVRMAAHAREQGVDVSIETCPHYLFFTHDDVERLGAVAKCAPPLRRAEERERLWQHVARGTIDVVASDHSPTEPARKSGDFIDAWGGIAGVQSTLAVLIDRGHHDRAIPLERIASLTASVPARRFAIEGKGSLTIGNDADVAIVDIDESFTLAAGDLQQRHKISPYIGVTFRGAVKRTIRRGETIFLDGTIVTQTRGRFVRPERATAIVKGARANNHP
jgi:allantoinase